MRRFLDTLYWGAGWLAALSILGICAVVTLQVALNVISRLGGTGVNFTIPSYADFAGFALAAATFLAAASTLRHGVHIRVNLLVQRFPPRLTWLSEVAVLAVGAGMIAIATYWTAMLVGESWHYGDQSTGIIAVPLWIPQIPMVAGLGLLCVALVDTLVEAIRTGRPVLIDEGDA
ncbi:TRAP-type C4-dicarboxylate transport system, small permease component [Palleronia salina]|uniref:TRAP transporter small permease protein n=1 Tax=Palleronia salina TaxID=313368 RepID=A0A1M6LI23_9RHOB|nr:TRAP transporter small permease [Palleronia salina]SHJ70765.1 TRAP-type C4-dicarboxylate transport system, small permease component [Palleronia salina]